MNLSSKVLSRVNILKFHSEAAKRLQHHENCDLLLQGFELLQINTRFYHTVLWNPSKEAKKSELISKELLKRCHKWKVYISLCSHLLRFYVSVSTSQDPKKVVFAFNDLEMKISDFSHKIRDLFAAVVKNLSLVLESTGREMFDSKSQAFSKWKVCGRLKGNERKSNPFQSPRDDPLRLEWVTLETMWSKTEIISNPLLLDCIEMISIGFLDAQT